MWVSKRINITDDPQVHDEFWKYAGKKGIKVSTWIDVHMENFIERGKMIEEYRKEKRSSMRAFYFIAQ